VPRDVAVVTGRIGRPSGQGHLEELAAALERVRSMAVAEEAEVSDAVVARPKTCQPVPDTS
jgi:hypothetical protein